jgi:hypothetical protein
MAFLVPFQIPYSNKIILDSNKKLSIQKKSVNLLITKGVFMDSNIVIARANRTEPLKRTAVCVAKNLVYIKNPDIQMESEEGSGVGFPARDVFVFDEDIYKVLKKEWSEKRSTSPEIWAKLKRYDTHASKG